jgi:oligogalacturonide lyase
VIRHFWIVSLLVVFLWSCSWQEIPRLETGSQQPMPSEWIDKDTGHKIIRLVHREGDNRSFYFHNNPFVPAIQNEDDKMVFYGRIPGEDQKSKQNRPSMQLFTVNLQTLEVEQLTDHSKWIFGEIVGEKRREVFYQSSDSVFATHVDKHETRLVYVFPDSNKGSISTLNADETLLAGVFSVPEKREIYKKNPKKSSYFDLIYEAKLPHSLFTINIDTKELTIVHSDTAWLNHVQFSPTNPNNLMFCHEGPWHLLDRIWLMDLETRNIRLMHKRTVYREIAGHEFFSRDGKKIWFDLQVPRGETFYLASVDVETEQEKSFALKRDEWSIHFSLSPDQKIFAGDGGDSSQVAKAKDGMWIYLFKPQADSLKSERLVNMRHHDYDLEPNVHFSPDGKLIIFRANFEGASQVYAVEIEKFE